MPPIPVFQRPAAPTMETFEETIARMKQELYATVVGNITKRIKSARLFRIILPLVSGLAVLTSLLHLGSWSYVAVPFNGALAIWGWWFFNKQYKQAATELALLKLTGKHPYLGIME